MGDTNTRESQRIEGDIPARGAGGRGRDSNKEKNNNNSNTTGSTTAGGAGGTGTAINGPNSEGGTKAGEKKPVEVAVLIPPEKAEKPKRKRVAKKKADSIAQSDQISALLQSVSMIIASREGLEQWAIDKKEADSIAEPLANIIEKNEAMAKLAEHSDAISLLVAATVIVMPRVMITVDKKKAKPKKAKANIIKQEVKADDRPTINTEGHEKRKTISDTGTDNLSTTTVRKAFYSSIPATTDQLT